MEDRVIYKEVKGRESLKKIRKGKRQRQDNLASHGSLGASQKMNTTIYWLQKEVQQQQGSSEWTRQASLAVW